MRSAQSFRSAFTCPMSAWWRGFVRGYGVQDGRHPLSRRRRCAGACRKGFFARQRFSGSAPDASVIKAKVLRDVRACGLKPRQSLAHCGVGVTAYIQFARQCCVLRTASCSFDKGSFCPHIIANIRRPQKLLSE